MDFNHSMAVLLRIYTLVLCLACILRLFHGKVFIIKATTIMLNLYFVLMLQFFPDIYPNNNAGKGFGGLVFNGALILILTLAVIAYITKAQGITLFLGISEKNFVPMLRDALAAGQIEYTQNVDEITLLRNPAESYTHRPFLVGTGTYIFQSGTINSKENKPILLPLIKDTVRSSALNWSGRILLALIILFALFILLF
jgi:hypothetical protein